MHGRPRSSIFEKFVTLGLLALPTTLIAVATTMAILNWIERNAEFVDQAGAAWVQAMAAVLSLGLVAAVHVSDRISRWLHRVEVARRLNRANALLARPALESYADSLLSALNLVTAEDETVTSTNTKRASEVARVLNGYGALSAPLREVAAISSNLGDASEKVVQSIAFAMKLERQVSELLSEMSLGELLIDAKVFSGEDAEKYLQHYASQLGSLIEQIRSAENTTRTAIQIIDRMLGC